METQVLLEQLGALSYVGIFGVSMLANVVIPVPEEIVLLALGYLAGTGAVNGFILLPIIMTGLLVSDVVMYTLSKRGNRFIMFFYRKFFAQKVNRKQHWMKTHIEKVIFFSRFLVQLRFIGPFMAGHYRVPVKKFIKYDFAAIALYVPLFLFLGWYFHNRVQKIIENVHIIKNVVFLFFGVIILYLFLKSVYGYLSKWYMAWGES